MDLIKFVNYYELTYKKIENKLLWIYTLNNMYKLKTNLDFPGSFRNNN
jgi:hypothetical protein